MHQGTLVVGDRTMTVTEVRLAHGKIEVTATAKAPINMDADTAILFGADGSLICQIRPFVIRPEDIATGRAITGDFTLILPLHLNMLERHPEGAAP